MVLQDSRMMIIVIVPMEVMSQPPRRVPIWSFNKACLCASRIPPSGYTLRGYMMVSRIVLMGVMRRSAWNCHERMNQEDCIGFLSPEHGVLALDATAILRPFFVS